MATDIDERAKRRSVNMLNGRRWSLDEANKVYMMPTAMWNNAKNDINSVKELITPFLTRHFDYQLPRILELERYYKADNDIHYANLDKKTGRADNRVPSGFPKFITDISVGYSVGNPIKFQYNSDDGMADDKHLDDALTSFNSRNDESYHEKVMRKNLSVTGHAYELIYAKEGSNDLMLRAIDPANCFVVYDTSIEQHSLFAVRYYLVNFNDDEHYYVEVYTDEWTYYFIADGSPTANLLPDPDHTINPEPQEFGNVPITEYINSDERMGDWERVLDRIDAFDKGLSEMTNTQEDYSNAILQITGDFDTGDADNDTDEDGNTVNHPQHIQGTDGYMMLTPSIIPDSNGGNTVISPDAKYLVKDTNADGWKVYMDMLASLIHKDTNTPDTTDSNFAGQQSGAAMSYKLWGSDQERAIQQSLYTRGLMRRLRLCASYWELAGMINDSDDVENYNIVFTPNLPKNDAQIITNLSALVSAGKFSDETIRDYAEPVTGVSASAELVRLQNQANTEVKDSDEGTTFDPTKLAGDEEDNSDDEQEAASKPS